jgi:hypothetical protein
MSSVLNMRCKWTQKICKRRPEGYVSASFHLRKAYNSSSTFESHQTNLIAPLASHSPQASLFRSRKDTVTQDVISSLLCPAYAGEHKRFARDDYKDMFVSASFHMGKAYSSSSTFETHQENLTTPLASHSLQASLFRSRKNLGTQGVIGSLLCPTCAHKRFTSIRLQGYVSASFHTGKVDSSSSTFESHQVNLTAPLASRSPQVNLDGRHTANQSHPHWLVFLPKFRLIYNP